MKYGWAWPGGGGGVGPKGGQFKLWLLEEVALELKVRRGTSHGERWSHNTGFLLSKNTSCPGSLAQLVGASSGAPKG